MEGTPQRPGPTVPERVRAAPVSYALAAANVLVFLWVEAHGSSRDPGTLVRFGALYGPAVWAGEWWRLLSAAFLHVGFVHLAVNVGFGLGWCVLVERALGRARFLALYLLAAVGGSALSLLGHNLSAGASGAIFGVVGATLVLHRRAVGSWGAFVRSRAAQVTLANIAVFSIVGIWARFDELAHAGGFATGALAAWLWSRPAPRRAWPWAVFAAGLVALLALALRPDREWAASRAANGIAIGSIQAALGEGKVALARTLVDAARARGLAAPGLDYYEARVLAAEGDLEGALARLRSLAKDAQPAIREPARRAAARFARELGLRLVTGEDPVRGLLLLDEACSGGDADACRLASDVTGRMGR